MGVALVSGDTVSVEGLRPRKQALILFFKKLPPRASTPKLRPQRQALLALALAGRPPGPELTLSFPPSSLASPQPAVLSLDIQLS